MAHRSPDPATVIALAGLLLALPLAAPALAGEHTDELLARPYVRVHEDPGRADLMDLSGSELAWALRTEDGLEIRLTDLDAGSTRTVTEVPTGDAALSMGGFAFDGRWIVWADDRFGDLEVFAVDTETDELVRVTDHPGEDRQVDVDEGRVVWIRRDALWTAELPSGEPVLFKEGVGTLAEPSIDADRIVWSQASGANAFIVMGRIGEENATAFPRIAGQGSFGASIDGDHIVWSSIVFANGSSRRGIEGALIRMADLDPEQEVEFNIALHNLTEEPSSVKDPSVGGGWVSWLVRPSVGEPFLHVEQAEGDERFSVPGPVSKGHLSQDYLVVVRAEDGAAPIYARPLSSELVDDQGGIPLGLWLLAGLGIGLIVAGLLWRTGPEEDEDA